jgi:hypothetical protein
MKSAKQVREWVRRRMLEEKRLWEEHRNDYSFERMDTLNDVLEAFDCKGELKMPKEVE